MRKEMKKEMTIWQFTGYISAIILILCGITFLLSSCTEEMVPIGGGKNSGKMIEVQFSVNKNARGANEVITRNYSDRQTETVEIPMGDDLFMYATLEEDMGPKLRAEVLLEEGTLIRIVVLKFPSREFVAQSSYTVDGSGNLANGSLSVPEGMYFFHAYSCNSKTFLPSLNDLLETEIITPDEDLIWGTTVAVSILSSSSQVDILLYHKFSRARIEVNSPVYPITNMTNVSLSPGQKIILDCSTSQLLFGREGAPDFPQVFSWSSGFNVNTVYSDYRIVYTDQKLPVTVKIGSLELNGKTFTDLTATFDCLLLENMSYTLKLTIKNGSTWAGSNVYWDGEKLTFDAAGDTRHAGYQGVFFKWGSLIGIQPTRTNHVTIFETGVTAIYFPHFNPTNHELSYWEITPQNFMGMAFPWAYIETAPTPAVPSLLYDRNSKYLSDLPESMYSYEHDISPQGDICKYIGDTGAGPAGYRMPTSNEMGVVHSEFWTDLNPITIAGGWSRKGRYSDFVDYTDHMPDFDFSLSLLDGNIDAGSGRWINDSPYQGGAYYQGAFFPPSGQRDNNGLLKEVCQYGEYWTNSLTYIGGGVYQAYSTKFWWANVTVDQLSTIGTFSSAKPVRCVKKLPNEQ